MTQAILHPEVIGSIFVEKRFNVARVPSIEQVTEFFSLMPYGSRWHAFFSLAFYCGLRPIEISKLTTDNIIVDGDEWVGLLYEVGKPVPPGRPKKGQLPSKAKRKWNRIDQRRGDIPIGAMRALRAYWLTRCSFGSLFPKSYSQYGKQFSLLRKEMILRGFDNWGTTSEDYFRTLTSPSGDLKVEHDITPYSGRRFFVSCYYWLKSSENRNGLPDLIETQHRMAHSGSKDTQIYVYPWRDLGLSNDLIGKGWNILAGQMPTQKRINDFGG